MNFQIERTRNESAAIRFEYAFGRANLPVRPYFNKNNQSEVFGPCGFKILSLWSFPIECQKTQCLQGFDRNIPTLMICSISFKVFSTRARFFNMATSRYAHIDSNLPTH